MLTLNFIILCFSTITIFQTNAKRRYVYVPIIYHTPHYNPNSDEAPTSAPFVPTTTEQDRADAKKIVQAGFDEKIIASILPYRSLEHRISINEETFQQSQGTKLIEDGYKPNHKNNPPYKDLWFALVNYPVTVTAMFLGEFLHRRDETFIIMALTLCGKMQLLHLIYDDKHKNGLDKRCSKQRRPFSRLMRKWINGDREPDDDCEMSPDAIFKDAEGLKAEYPHWTDQRDGLEYILTKKCLKFGAAVIKKFEDDLNLPIEKAIGYKIKNHDLYDAYTSLVHYVKDKYDYIAQILFDHSDRTDRWAVWIMAIGVVSSDDWPQIDAAFAKRSNNVTLTDFILKSDEPDKILLQTMAAMIYPKFTDTPIKQ